MVPLIPISGEAVECPILSEMVDVKEQSIKWQQ